MQKFLQQIIKEAGSLAKKYYLKGVKKSFKTSPSDLVTEADLAVNRFLIKKIRRKFPNHGIISEEEKKEINPGAEYVWVMDPIDGTRNFANHIAVWCTMVGITRKGKPYLGCIYDAMNDELFFAEKGKGAFLNKHKIEVNKKKNLEYCHIVFSGGVKDDSPYSPKKYKEYKIFHDNLVGDKGFWIHNYATILSVCHLATGRIDAILLNSGLYHDYLAGYVIATEAGAKFTDCEGKNWQRGRKDVVVANPVLHKKLLKLFK